MCQGFETRARHFSGMSNSSGTYSNAFRKRSDTLQKSQVGLPSPKGKHKSTSAFCSCRDSELLKITRAKNVPNANCSGSGDLHCLSVQWGSASLFTTSRVEVALAGFRSCQACSLYTVIAATLRLPLVRRHIPTLPESQQMWNHDVSWTVNYVFHIVRFSKCDRLAYLKVLTRRRGQPLEIQYKSRLTKGW